MSIERNQNLVLEDTLIVEVEARKSQAKDFRALGRRRDQLECKTPARDRIWWRSTRRMTLIGLYAVLDQGRSEHYFEFWQRSRRNEEPCPKSEVMSGE